MPVNVPIAGPALARGLKNEFMNTWKLRTEDMERRLGSFFRGGIPSTQYAELYGYWEPPLFPSRRPWGEGVESKPFRARNFEVINHSFTSSVEWHGATRWQEFRNIERAGRVANHHRRYGFVVIKHRAERTGRSWPLVGDGFHRRIAFFGDRRKYFDRFRRSHTR